MSDRKQDAGAQCPCRKALEEITRRAEHHSGWWSRETAREALSTPCPLEAQFNQLKVDHNHCSDQGIRAHALITKIMDRVDAAYPGERQGDWDVLDQGVGRLVADRDRLYAEAQEAKYVEQKALEHAARLEEQRDRLSDALKGAVEALEKADIPNVTRLITQCREHWEPFLEDSIGVTYGGYRHHDTDCGKCRPMLAILAALSTAKEALK